MTIKGKILLFIEEMKIRKSDFFLRTGIAASNFKGVAMNSELGGDKIVKILTEFPNLSPDWLLLGLGPMIRSDQEQQLHQMSAQSESVDQPDSSFGEAAAYYKMYEKKDAENKTLIEEVGTLKERIRQLEETQHSDQCQKSVEKEPDAFIPATSGGSGKDAVHIQRTASLQTSLHTKT